MRRGGDQQIPQPLANRPGGPPPWEGSAARLAGITLGDVRAAMASAPPPARAPAESGSARPSAVLAVLYESPPGGQVRVVLTRRAQHLRSHRGEVSFPGGAQEAGEEPLAAALREACEEVALDAARVEVVGQLDHLETFMSRSYIVPFVGVLSGELPELRPNPSEVERILYVSLDELVLPGVYREERWGVPPLDHPMHFFELVGDTIWGATARMLVNLLAILTGTEWRDPDGW